jgi:hypothetical protein
VAPATAAAVAPGALGVYDDALASGWVDWSWGCTRNFATTSPVFSGADSLAVTFQAWGGLYFRRASTSVSGMATLELYANGGASAGKQIAVRAISGTASTPNVPLSTYCSGGTIPANAWTRCRVPLSALLPAGGALDGFWLQEGSGINLPVMYIDSVALLPAAPAQPTGVTATASASSISISWTAVAGATGYDVSRATSSAGPFVKLTTSPQPGTTYTDNAVAPGTYWYQVVASNAGGTGPASAAVSATVSAPSAPASAPIYGDALASGWMDWSWGSTRNFANPSPVASGADSLAVTFQAWGGLYLRSATPVSGPTALDLSVNGGATAGNKIQLSAVSGNTSLPKVILSDYCAGGTIPANAWTRCHVPLSVLLPAGGGIDGFMLQEIDGGARPAMYFDDIALTGSSSSSPPPAVPAAPTGLAATVSSGAVSLSWAAASGATGYVVSRGTAAGGPFTALNASPQAGTTYQDAAVAAGTTYWYQVAAVNAAGSSVACAPVSASVPAAPPAPVTVKVTPASATVDACTTAQFSAQVANATDGTVTWSVQEGSAGGTVDTTGKYTAPSTAGTYHLVATSKASSAASATATVVVQDHILSIAVTPASASVAASGTQQFTATVTTTCGTFNATAAQ